MKKILLVLLFIPFAFGVEDVMNICCRNCLNVHGGEMQGDINMGYNDMTWNLDEIEQPNFINLWYAREHYFLNMQGAYGLRLSAPETILDSDTNMRGHALIHVGSLSLLTDDGVCDVTINEDGFLVCT